MNILSLSIVILSHNQESEARLLVPQLKPYAQQILVLDDDSTDSIRDFCQTEGIEFCRHSLAENFAEHRNAAFRHVTGDWTLFLDADEQPEEGLLQEIHEKMESKKFDALMIPRRDIFLEKQLWCGETSKMTLLRCAKTPLGSGKWQRPIHETWNVPSRSTGVTQHILIHTPHPSLTSMFEKFHRYARLEARFRSQQTMERTFLELTVYPVAKFVLNYLLRSGWRDGWRGFIHAWMMAYLSLLTRVFMLERES